MYEHTYIYVYIHLYMYYIICIYIRSAIMHAIVPAPDDDVTFAPANFCRLAATSSKS